MQLRSSRCEQAASPMKTGVKAGWDGRQPSAEVCDLESLCRLFDRTLFELF